MQVFEVAQVATYIKQLMEYDEVLADLWIHGEVSNLSRSPSGHIYFTLKDGHAQIRCALFRNSQRHLAVDLSNGLSVFAHGRISFYEAQGTCQLYVDVLQPEGVGMAYLQFEALRAKLETEGLFAPERKRQLPAFPRRIGLVTSPTGAVIHDFITIVQRRYPLVEIVVAHSAVQGEHAPGEIIAAIEGLNQYHEYEHPLDMIVLARGGGSMEDLAAFNHEGLARCIFASAVPVVSAIGHETDYTIADLVADLRAPTPSAAAELVTPNMIDFRMKLADLQYRLTRSMQDALQANKWLVEQASASLDRHSPMSQVTAWRREVDDVVTRGARALTHRLQVSREQLRGSTLTLSVLSPYQTLERGYSICYERETGMVIRSKQGISAGDMIQIQVTDGKIDSIVTEPLGKNGAHEG